MQNKKGFTLMEVLVAASLFAILSSLAAAFFINVTRTERKTELLNAMYEDARVIMEIMSREIRDGTVDYEEYYNIHVLNADQYGINRGAYASRFYYPGFTIDDAGDEVVGENPKNLGVECVSSLGEIGIFPCADDNTAVYTLSVDQDFGKNPYNSLDGTGESAFCKNDKYQKPREAAEYKCSEVPANLNEEELYLISKDGRSKTIIAKKNPNPESPEDYVLAMVELDGIDEDSNGIVDKFKCKTEYAGCSNDDSNILQTEDLTNLAKPYSPFIPISPLRSSVRSLKFIIWPVEDPYRAFAEPKDVQYQPSVTIIMTLEPSAVEKENYPGTPPSITVQTTVSAGAKNKIQTYPPTKDLAEIKAVIK